MSMGKRVTTEQILEVREMILHRQPDGIRWLLATLEEAQGRAFELEELASAADFAHALAQELDRLAGRVASPAASAPTASSSRRTPRGRDPSTRRPRKPILRA